ncbi:MAG: DUF6478 family protein [Paracoccaceae bacterium]
MVLGLNNTLDYVAGRAGLRRWNRHADEADAMSAGELRVLRGQARAIRRQIDRFLFVAEGRLARPAIGNAVMPRPVGTDWAWRPEVWRGPLPVRGQAAVASKTEIGAGATIFHDCSTSELTVRQIRNTREADLAPFGLRMDVFRFDGSFLSLVLDLPDEAAHGLRLRHLVRLDTVIEMEKPLEIFARLNIKHGPNVEQVVREIPPGQTEASVEFDLAYTRVNEKRIEKLWIDLIFEGPELNQIVLRDVTCSRRPRAEL